MQRDTDVWACGCVCRGVCGVKEREKEREVACTDT